MLALKLNSNRNRTLLAVTLILLASLLALPASVYASKKKKADATADTSAQPKVEIDTSKLVWPGPPNIARVKYLNYFAGMKIDYSAPAAAEKKKQGWMDRVAGTKQVDNNEKLKAFPFQLLGPYGIAFDSKNLVFVADQ